jgi:hypothetical protein
LPSTSAGSRISDPLEREILTYLYEQDDSIPIRNIAVKLNVGEAEAAAFITAYLSDWVIFLRHDNDYTQDKVRFFRKKWE